MKKIYLAIPYSGIEEESYQAANKVAAKLIADGNIVFSPITHSHPIKLGITQNTYETWLAQDKAFVDWADEIYIVILCKGLDCEYGITKVENSKGVQAEIAWANEQNKPINFYYQPVNE